MFDIGFAELLLIAVVGLLVIGPERLPGAIRTGSAWLNRLRRGFNEIKHEVQRELHNDSVMEELRKTSESVRKETGRWREELTGEVTAAEQSTGEKSTEEKSTEKTDDLGSASPGDGPEEQGAPSGPPKDSGEGR